MSVNASNANAARVGEEVAKLFVFDVRLGTREDNEHEKILFYHPATDPLNKQQVSSQLPGRMPATPSLSTFTNMASWPPFLLQSRRSCFF